MYAYDYTDRDAQDICDRIAGALHLSGVACRPSEDNQTAFWHTDMDRAVEMLRLSGFDIIVCDAPIWHTDVDAALETDPEGRNLIAAAQSREDRERLWPALDARTALLMLNR